MKPSSSELQRLLHLLMDTASKAEQDAYATGWRDCHAAMVKAMSGLTESLAAVPANEEPAAEPAPVVAPVETSSWHDPMPQTNSAAESAFAN